MCAIGEEGWRSCGEGLECYYNQTEQDQTVQWFGHCRTKETGKCKKYHGDIYLFEHM